MRELREAMREADAVLIATPEYNHSIPGVLKNALDWASRPAGQSALNGTPAAAIGASTGMFGAVWAQAETRKVLGALGGRVIEAELPVARADKLLVDGRLELEPQQSERLEEILAELIAAAEEAEELSPRAGRGLVDPHLRETMHSCIRSQMTNASARQACGRAKKAIAEKWATAAAITSRWKTSW